VSTGIRNPRLPSASRTTALGQPALRRYLEGYVRRRVRPCDADDTVQAVLCAALEARRVPEDDEELRRWVTGIARKKIAALFTLASRASLSREESQDTSEAPASAAPVEAIALVAWAEREAAAHAGETAARTLAWMAREGEGEKLESIAAEEKESATLVRQRVSRLRRWLRARWSVEIAAAIGAVVAIAILAALLLAKCAGSLPHAAPRMIALPDEAPARPVKELRDETIDRLAPPPALPAAPSATPAPASTEVPMLSTPPAKRPSRATGTGTAGSSL
jgi:DNA-directed RNA polymerase specialized sigma24 family protein